MDTFYKAYDCVLQMSEGDWLSTIFSVAISSVVALIVFVITNRRKVVSDYNVKFFDIYHQICDEIIELVLPLTDLSLISTRQVSDEYREYMINKLSELFYRYYNYLPGDVLMSMLCLYCCLKNKGVRPYMYIKKRKIHLVRPCTTKRDVMLLLRKVSIENYLNVRKDNHFVYRIKQSYRYAFKEGHSFAQRIICFCKAYTRRLPIGRYHPRLVINIQARYVICCIDKYFGSDHLAGWDSEVKKYTIA